MTIYQHFWTPYISRFVFSMYVVLGNEVKEGDIRLIGTTNFVNQYVYGRVEIFLSGVWGTVSDRGAYASIICRQLGYNTYRK